MTDKARIAGAVGGALGLSGFAAAVGLCCTVPWAVALLGVTGAVAFARLAFLLPYALGGSALMLGVAFWWAYRPTGSCADATCATDGRRMLRVIVWLGTVLVGALSLVALTLRVAV